MSAVPVFLLCIFIGAMILENYFANNFYINSGIIHNNEGDTISSKCI